MILELEDATFNTYSDVIDSREVIERIRLIEEYLGNLEGEEDLEENEKIRLAAKQGAEEELGILKKLEAECEGSSDWEYGEALIRDSYFENYAREFAEDIGCISGNEKWPLNCIDWSKAARELQYDYTQVSFDEVDYWIRSC
jgi:hypothetical protein